MCVCVCVSVKSSLAEFTPQIEPTSRYIAFLDFQLAEFDSKVSLSRYDSIHAY